MKELKRMFIIMILLAAKVCSASSMDTLPQVILPIEKARIVAIDLTKYAGCVEIVKVMQGQIMDLRMMNSQKDTIISKHERNARDYQGIIANDKIISVAQDQKYNDLNRKYKRSVRVGRFQIVLLVAAVAGGAYLILK